jgi:hypothetical protein
VRKDEKAVRNLMKAEAVEATRTFLNCTKNAELTPTDGEAIVEGGQK